ncbi:MAG TPA: L-histidine N(alpha)-methyltransferase [Candidatus Saccharimonadia bacterium]
MERLVDERKKYRNSRTSRVITPSAKFYELFTAEQVNDIASNLDINHEIPSQYGYFDSGAKYWSDYAVRMYENDAPNLLKRTVKLFELNDDYLDGLVAKYDRVNVIDLGPGNALPVKDLMARLINKGILGKYVGIDLSPDMLEVARQNITSWFGDAVTFEGYLADLTQARFNHLLAPAYIGEQAGKTMNIVLFLGGTISNFRNPNGVLQIIHDSMGRNDIFVLARKLDTAQSRRFFDFSVTPGESSLSMNDRLVLDLLNVDPAFYNVEMGYDTVKHQRYIQVRLLMALRVDFKLGEGVRSVHLEKGDTILLWRSWQQNSVQVVEQLIGSGFYPLQISQTDDMEYMLSISRLQTESD